MSARPTAVVSPACRPRQAFMLIKLAASLAALGLLASCTNEVSPAAVPETAEQAYEPTCVAVQMDLWNDLNPIFDRYDEMSAAKDDPLEKAEAAIGAGRWDEAEVHLTLINSLRSRQASLVDEMADTVLQFGDLPSELAVPADRFVRSSRSWARSLAQDVDGSSFSATLEWQSDRDALAGASLCPRP